MDEHFIYNISGKLDLTLKLLNHTFDLVLIKLPMQVVGMAAVLPLAAIYKLGEFPKAFAWFDDYRGRDIRERKALNDRYKMSSYEYCAYHFGPAHCALFEDYNQTFFRRYIWAAFRNSINTFQHTFLGKSKIDSSVWEIFGYKRLFYIKGKTYYFRYRVGYKTRGNSYLEGMLGHPYQWVFSLGIRSVEQYA